MSNRNDIVEKPVSTLLEDSDKGHLLRDTSHNAIKLTIVFFSTMVFASICVTVRGIGFALENPGQVVLIPSVLCMMCASLAEGYRTRPYLYLLVSLVVLVGPIFVLGQLDIYIKYYLVSILLFSFTITVISVVETLFWLSKRNRTSSSIFQGVSRAFTCGIVGFIFGGAMSMGKSWFLPSLFFSNAFFGDLMISLINSKTNDGKRLIKAKECDKG